MLWIGNWRRLVGTLLVWGVLVYVLLVCASCV